jgi:nucleoside-diphosphate-sugar epimerase
VTGRVLIAGASGLVGGAAARAFAGRGWDVVGTSRRAPTQDVPGTAHLPLDLTDADGCRRALADVPPFTHLAYAAINETPGDLVASWSDPEHAGRNGAMFANLLDAMLATGDRLAHVSLVHGGKAYGVHRDVDVPVPLRESLPRPDFDDFYFRQEDHVASRAAESGGRLRWTVLRAMIVVGGSRDSNLNGLLALCVLASIRRARGLNLPRPATAMSGAIIQMTDVNLLADAIAWSATAPEAADHIFNVANGDVFTWRDLWPVIADEIGLAVGAPETYSVRAEIAAHAETWAALVNDHDLPVPADPAEYLGESAALSDFALAADRDVIESTIKIRRAGFHDCIDTAESVVTWIRRWRAEGMLPPR